ncbi:hypothetical protein [Polyangium sorediatum]|uniref:Uncharacterized protein n=1 Tax=Polyangium sorediatum TaxID=889274 RepID=A0ABT6NM60_9BACT|nr:hypothetical protein [Polyangium sorediatum]MDI1429419.1 hypothetical protein [Polyangium sorediatum]
MSHDPPDPTLYVRAPIMTAEAGITLCRALFAACPKDASPAVMKSAAKVNAVADKAQTALAIRQKTLGKVSDDAARLIDQAGDASWGALRTRLLAYADLPVAKYQDAKRAAELVTILFGPDGLSFLKEAYPVQWSTADTILKRIDEEGLEKDIDRIAGKVFLDNVRAQHEQYGAMVQGTLLREQAEGVNLADQVRAMGRAIVEYATKVCASVDEDDASSIAAARSALRPLDAYREAAARRGSNEKPPAGTETIQPG